MLALRELLSYALLGIGKRITGTRRGRNYRVHPQVILAAGAREIEQGRVGRWQGHSARRTLWLQVKPRFNRALADMDF